MPYFIQILATASLLTLYTVSGDSKAVPYGMSITPYYTMSSTLNIPPVKTSLLYITTDINSTDLEQLGFYLHKYPDFTIKKMRAARSIFKETFKVYAYNEYLKPEYFACKDREAFPYAGPACLLHIKDSCTCISQLDVCNPGCAYYGRYEPDVCQAAVGVVLLKLGKILKSYPDDGTGKPNKKLLSLKVKLRELVFLGSLYGLLRHQKGINMMTLSMMATRLAISPDITQTQWDNIVRTGKLNAHCPKPVDLDKVYCETNIRHFKSFCRLPDFVSRKRRELTTDPCPVILIFAFCDDDKTEKMKAALDDLKKGQHLIKKMVDLNKDKILELAQIVTSDKGYITTSVNTLSSKLIDFAKAYNDNVRQQKRIRYQKVMYDLVSGNFPPSLFPNRTVYNGFFNQTGMYKNIRDTNNAHFHLKVMDYGSWYGRLTMVTYYNYMPPGYHAFDLHALPQQFPNFCALPKILADKVILIENTTTVIGFKGQEAIYTFDGKIDTLTCEQAIIFQLATNYQGPNIFWEKANNADDILQVCRNITFVKTGERCAKFSPMPGFSWQPKERQLNYQGFSVLQVNQPIIYTIDPTINLPPPPDGDFDFDDYKKKFKKAEDDWINNDKKTKEDIEKVRDKVSMWEWIAIGLGCIALIVFLGIFGKIVFATCLASKAKAAEVLASACTCKTILNSTYYQDVRLTGIKQPFTLYASKGPQYDCANKVFVYFASGVAIAATFGLAVMLLVKTVKNCKINKLYVIYKKKTGKQKTKRIRAVGQFTNQIIDEAYLLGEKLYLGGKTYSMPKAHKLEKVCREDPGGEEYCKSTPLTESTFTSYSNEDKKVQFQDTPRDESSGRQHTRRPVYQQF